MSDATPIPEGPFEEFEGPPVKSGLLADPVVRYMIFALMGLVILFLVTAIGVLVTGVLTINGPRSIAEQQLLIASAQSVGTAGDASAPYVNALTAAGDLPAARLALAQARGSASPTATTPGLDLAEARILSAGGDYEKAVILADQAMKGYKARYDAKIAEGGKSAEVLKTAGVGADHDNAALVKAYALVKLKRWQDAVGAFDVFIVSNPTSPDVLVDRGNAKAEINDKAGAEKDFQEALRFGPDNPEALAGLKRIGVAQ